jgi:hypothetical protein
MDEIERRSTEAARAAVAAVVDEKLARVNRFLERLADERQAKTELRVSRPYRASAADGAPNCHGDKRPHRLTTWR